MFASHVYVYFWWGEAGGRCFFLIRIPAHHRTQANGVASGVVPSVTGFQYGPIAGGGLSVGHPQGFEHPDGSFGPYPAAGTRPLTPQSPYSQYKSVQLLLPDSHCLNSMILIVSTPCKPQLSFDFHTLPHALRCCSLATLTRNATTGSFGGYDHFGYPQPHPGVPSATPLPPSMEHPPVGSGAGEAPA